MFKVGDTIRITSLDEEDKRLTDLEVGMIGEIVEEDFKDTSYIVEVKGANSPLGDIVLLFVEQMELVEISNKEED